MFDFGDTRRVFFTAWQKHLARELLEPVEQQVAQVIQEHPEYHALFASEDAFETLAQPAPGVANPFMHMGLHLAIREQVATNRPHGITTIWRRLLEIFQDPHRAEHAIMDPLAECLWHAQRENVLPDESQYLERLRSLVRK